MADREGEEKEDRIGEVYKVSGPRKLQETRFHVLESFTISPSSSAHSGGRCQDVRIGDA